jgi:lysophospholipase L1-like esterase
MRVNFINALALPALPLIHLQGRRVDRMIPRLLPARGPRRGNLEGAGAPLRFLVVGESTAVGVGVETMEQSVAFQLARVLGTHSGRAVAWEAVGRPGATVGQVHTELLPKIEAGPRDLVLVLCGANDAMALRHADVFAGDVQRFVTALRERVGDAAILISSVPPLGTFPALPNPLRAYLGAWARWLDLTLERISLPGVHYAPVRIPMSASLFASDGFHPGPTGYQAWAETLAAAALRHKLVPARI